MPDVVKKGGLALLSVAGVLRLAEFLSSRDVLILTYHRVIPVGQRVNGQRPPNTLFTDEFEEQMAFVARRFKVLSGDELRSVVEGTDAVSRYSIAITFDDGYQNNFSHAFPILRRYGLHAVFFVATNFIDNREESLWFDRLDRLLSSVQSREILEQLRRLHPTLPATREEQIRPYFKRLSSARQADMLDRLEQHFGKTDTRNWDTTVYSPMSWDQVRLLASAGMTIGSHTVTHQILAAASPSEAQAELVLSRRRVREETGQSCWCFAYPNGARQDFRAADELAVRAAGYLCAFTQISGSINGGTSRFALPRISVPDAGDIRIFRSHLSGIQRAIKSIRPGI